MFSSKQDGHCSREEHFHLRCQALRQLGIHVFLPGWRRRAEPAGLPLTRHLLQTGQEPRAGGSKRKEGRAWAGNKAKKPSRNCQQAPPLRGCWQGLLLRVGQSWTAGLQQEGTKSRRNPRNVAERTAHTHTKITSIFCAHIFGINAWKVVCNWKERKLHLSSLRTTMSSTFNYISVLVNNPPWWINYLWTIGMFLCDANDLDHSYECEWFINFFVCKKSSSKPLHTFPLGRPNSLSAWKITFSVLPDAKVLVMLKQ